MRVVIIGCSKVGEALTRIMCDEGHDVVVVDTDSEKIEYITEKYDCNGFVGNGGSPIILSFAFITVSPFGVIILLPRSIAQTSIFADI